MATIEQRNGKYRVKIRVSGSSKSATFKTYAEAKEWSVRVEAELIDGQYGNVPKRMTFGDLIKRYLKEVTVRKHGAKQETYRLSKILKSDLAHVLIVDLSPQDFANWRDVRLKEVSPDSVIRELSSLSAVCTHAMKEWSLLRDNYVTKIKTPTAAKPRSRRPTNKEIEDILLALQYSEDEKVESISQRIGCIVLFAIETAMRSGEICGLTWDNIYLNRRVAHLDKTKNGSERDVPLSKRAIEILERVRHIDSVSVFAVADGTRDALFRRARDVAGIKDLHFHDLRREALSRMAKKLNVMDLAKVSGHRDIRILQNTYYAPDIGGLADLLD